MVELYSRITKNKSQLTYYNSGIGTYAKPSWRSYTYMKQMLSNTVDLAIAWNFENVIIGAYRWLADVYQLGDQIFLFGFSRGAYQVRALAAMIEAVGLIYPGNQEQIPFAWELYSNSDPNVHKFKEAFSRDKVDLHFLGAWYLSSIEQLSSEAKYGVPRDTVSSIGIFPGDLLPMTDRCKHITHFRHALALDECRVKFLPEYIVGPTKENGSKKEVWFAGTHSDIGGGNKANKDLNLGAEPLKWMMEEAQIAGLAVKLHDVKMGIPNADITGTLHRGRGRNVMPSHQIHWTVRASLKKQGDGVNGDKAKHRFTYEPKAKLWGEDNGKLPWEAILVEQPPPLAEDPALPSEDIRKPTWEGGKYLIDAIDLVKDGRGLESLTQDNSEQWAKRLEDYLTNDDPESQVKQQEQQGPGISASDNTGNSMDELNPAHLLSYVTPRVCTLLRQWTAIELSLPNTSSAPNSVMSKALTVLKLKSKPRNEPPPAEVGWSIEYIPKRDRSLQLARIAMDIILDLLKIGKHVWRVRNSIDPSNQTAEVIGEYWLTLIVRLFFMQRAAVLDITEAAVTVITKLAANASLNATYLYPENARQAFYYADAVPTIMPLLPKHDLLKARFKLVTEVMHSLEALAHNEDCAYEIVDQPNFSALLAFLEPQTQIEDQKQQQILVVGTVSAVATLAETCQPRWYYEESRSEELFPRIVNSEVVDKLVQILGKKKHPAINGALRVMKIISQHRGHLLLTGDMPAIEFICDSVGVSLDALTILRNFVSYDYVREMMIKKEVVLHVASLIESKDSELALMALGFVEELLGHDDSRGQLLKGNIMSTLTKPLNSNQSELVEAGLDVAVAITSQSDSVENALVDILVSLASKTKNHKAMLAIGGVAAHQELDYDLGTLIPAFITFMEDPDNTMVEDALNVLTKLTENDKHREEMLEAHVVQSLTRLLDLATKSSSYYSPSASFVARATITC
ncbi:hypothetical protein FRC06_001189 [Ceratobasidium sp. 370]|nr:hypothetical protein FRC06_001189 [Ceratobasidium sp. 370]